MQARSQDRLHQPKGQVRHSDHKRHGGLTPKGQKQRTTNSNRETLPTEATTPKAQGANGRKEAGDGNEHQGERDPRNGRPPKIIPLTPIILELA